MGGSCYSRHVMSRLVATAFAGLAFLFAGCSDNSTTPTGPTGVGVLQITAARTTLRTGETMSLTVTGPGGTAVTGGAWTTSDASVVTVSATGVASATRAGRATVTVSTSAGTGSLALRVVPKKH